MDITDSGNFRLEICTASVESAAAAERGGAHRIELCSHLPVGGLTPNSKLMEATRQAVKLPIHVLLRPRAGDFVYNNAEFETMRKDIDLVKRIGFNGVVIGILDGEKKIDVARTKELVGRARPLSVTFHRAFDECVDIFDALQAVIATGANRILTSGGQLQAIHGIPNLARLVQAARGRIAILPAGGIDASDAAQIIRATSVRELHTSLGASHLEEDEMLATSCTEYAERVRGLVTLLEKLAQAK